MSEASSAEEYVEKRLKIALIGDSGAGKTSIAVRFCYNDFSRQHTPTAGIDFFLKELTIGIYKNVKLYLWDISGMSLRSSLLDKYLFEANIILLIYDVTNVASFDILEEWMNEIREISDEFETLPLIALVGNKCDMEHQRTVKRERSVRFAAENGFPYQDMSARTGEAVSLSIVNLSAKALGIRLTKSDQDFYRPIVAAEIGDSVDVPVEKNQTIVKRKPNKKSISIHHFRPNLPMAKSKACSLQ